MVLQDKNLRLLVVDDDDHSVLILKQIFKNLPYELETANRGQQAIEMAKALLPDLILLDILMPDLSGLEVCKKLQKDPQTKSIPVIFITSLNQKEELVEGFKAGAVDYITKPYQKDELRLRVENHLRLKHAGDVIARQNQELQLEIEQRKSTEEKFQALSQAAFEAVIFVKDDNIIEYNDAATQLFKSFSGELGNIPVEKLVSRAEKERIKTAFYSSDQGPWEFQFTRIDKSIFTGQLKIQEYIYRGEKIKVLAISDISRLKQLEQEVRNVIIETEEKERKRFAMDLHDGLGALLSTLKIYVTLLQKPGKSEEDREFLLNELKTNTNEAVASARRIANNLMPGTLNDYGLLPAIESFCHKVKNSGAINIQISSPENFPRLAKNIEVNLYRVFTELINNTLKHAGADNIHLNLALSNGSLMVHYQDDGKGFDYKSEVSSNTGSHGLRNIATRIELLNGNFEVYPPENKGVCYKIEIPV